MPTGCSLTGALMVLVAATMCVAAQTAQLVSAKVRLELPLTSQEVPELRQMLLRFAEDNQLKIVDIGETLPISRVMRPVQGRRPFMLELSRADLRVLVNDFKEQNRFVVSIYELNSSSNFDRVASELKGRLRQRWPQKLKLSVDP